MKKYYIITLLALSFSLLFSIVPEVSDINITSDSTHVFINYALNADGQCQVVVVASDDAGSTFRIYPTALTGDVGNSVSPSDTKQITWDYLADNIEPGDNFQIKLIARDNPYPAEDNSNFLSFSKVEGGTFHNGTANVTLGTFFMDRYETTQGEYEAVVGTNPSYHSGASKPVENVSWFDALKYCNIRSLQEGLIPCYNYSNQGLDPYEWSVENLSATAFSFDFGANGYRLPTEMEWMFAAKGGTEQPATGYNQWPGTANSEDLGEYAWGSFNAGGETHPVATKLPNQLYLYDMAGNVREWCWDVYDNYDSNAQTDPIGPNEGLSRITRGGDYGNGAGNLTLTNRYSEVAYLNFLSIGFRSVRRMEDSSLEVTSTPLFSPEPGSFDSAQSITISSGSGRSTIYYTLDGSYPDLNSTLYTTPITISDTTTIKARAYRDGYQPSEVVTANYDIDLITENFVLVEAGTFHNGYADITLSPFYMSKYETTQADYESIMEENPSSFSGANNPVEQVDWFDAVKYCNLKSIQEGLTPCYDYNREGTNPNSWSEGWDLVNNHALYRCDFSANGYRLPTEMEWMYAAKGGDQSSAIDYNLWAGTNNDTELEAYAWYNANSASSTHPVGTKRANQLGIYDMAGNVWEWCWDKYEAYNTEAQTDPVGALSSTFRMYRGGSWSNNANNCKLNLRIYRTPATIGSFLGFRLVRRLENVSLDITPNPIISPESGSYSFEQTVSISSMVGGVECYYTLDGSNPDLTSNLYTRPFTLSDSTTVKVRAYREGEQPSEIITAVYDIDLITDNFIFVESGSFYNGTADVTLSPFYIGKYEVTQAEYEAVMNTNPSNFSGSDKPVERVTWYDAVEYCNNLSIQLGLTPCYDTSDWSCNFSANGYRLPTEMEWMFAAKGGNVTPADGYDEWAGTDVDSELTNYAWYSSNAEGSTHSVGLKLPNQLGIYDMAGNVFEWCNDWWSDYNDFPQTDPIGFGDGYTRVIRGGSWAYVGSYCKIASRGAIQPSMNPNYLGFRLVQRIDYTPLEVTPTPLISPQAGDYSSAQTVSISNLEAGVVYYYTLDGSNPDLTSILYTAPFTLSETTTVKAKAYQQGLQPSEVVTAIYDIDLITDNFIFVESGSFYNGTADVTLSPFYIGKYEVTQAEYEAVMNTNPSNFSGSDKPVERVTWYDAVEYCNDLSIQLGLTPCYDTSDWSCNFSANGYRLPTEMEWMFAAKGGNVTPADGYDEWAGTDVEADLTNYAWYYENNGDLDSDLWGTKQVGTKLPNQLGIYDMSGNVDEWCNDWYGDYSSTPELNPVGVDSGTHKVRRGGGWGQGSFGCKVTYRGHSPFNSYDSVGFRIVRRIDHTPLETTPAPLISPQAGDYSSAQTVSINNLEAGTVCYYTLDGSNPDLTSILYTAPFTLSDSTTVKVKAYQQGLQPSEVVTAEFNISNYDVIFSDSFESYPDFFLEAGLWTLIDVDVSPTYQHSEISYPNEGSAMAYIVFNPSMTTPPSEETSLEAHTGAKFMASISSNSTANNDWLIMQAFTPTNTATFNFWAKSYSNTFGPERFNVLVSDGSVNPNDFTSISGDSYTEVPAVWTQYSYNLDAYANNTIRIAIQCVSDDAFIFMVDDVEIITNDPDNQ